MKVNKKITAMLLSAVDRGSTSSSSDYGCADSCSSNYNHKNT